MLVIDLRGAIEAIKKRNASLVAIQVPEGLKPRLRAMVRQLEEKSNATIVAFIDPCYGACDLADERAKVVGAELLIHFGHSGFVPKAVVETLYVPLHYKINQTKLNSLAGNLAGQLKAANAKKIALCTVMQYLPHMLDLKKALQRKGFSVLIGKGKGIMQGQVLGCNYSAVRAVEAEADAVVLLADGLFHAIGISFLTEKPLFIFDTMGSEVKRLGKQRDLFLRKRMAAIARAMDAQHFAVLLSTKKGQLRVQKALRAKQLIKEAGKNAVLLAADFIRPEYLLGMKFDCIVSTACPRIAIDDSGSFKQPLLSLEELQIALGKKKFEDYKFGELL